MKTLAVLSCLLLQVVIYQTFPKSTVPDYSKAPIAIEQNGNYYRPLGKSIAPDYNRPVGNDPSASQRQIERNEEKMRRMGE